MRFFSKCLDIIRRLLFHEPPKSEPYDHGDPKSKVDIGYTYLVIRSFGGVPKGKLIRVIDRHSWFMAYDDRSGFEITTPENRLIFEYPDYAYIGRL